LYRYLGGIGAKYLPLPMMNIVNGGSHAANNLDIQEFMIIPVGANTFAHAVRWVRKFSIISKSFLSKKKMVTAVGDEGGFAPDLQSNEAALN
jgi:enolase